MFVYKNYYMMDSILYLIYIFEFGNDFIFSNNIRDATEVPSFLASLQIVMIFLLSSVFYYYVLLTNNKLFSYRNYLIFLILIPYNSRCGTLFLFINIILSVPHYSVRGNSYLSLLIITYYSDTFFIEYNINITNSYF